MLRVLKISGYYFGKDKFGNDQYQIDGIQYDHPSNYHGNPSKRIWIRADRIQLNDNCIGKDLYCEYNERGNVAKTEVK